MIFIKLRQILFIFFISSLSSYIFALESISISSDIKDSPSLNKSIDDVIFLLKKACNCEIERNKDKAQILIQLKLKNNTDSKSNPIPLLHYPEHSYVWTSKRFNSKQLTLLLESTSVQGLSFGLYGLLQEQLGFRFLHPKESIIPNLNNWPLTENFIWEAKPRFQKKGFHLHTMHPIELAEALLDVNYKNGIEEIKTYIDWLARNQQNYFEFNLLESIDRKKWPNYIKQVVEYGKSRGIIMGVDISLHMVQQKAFMLYKNFPASVLSKKKQIEKNVKFLADIGFQVFNVEFSTTEFSTGNFKKKKELQLFLGNLLDSLNIKMMGREHVVQKDKMIKVKKHKDYQMSDNEILLDKKRGLLVHSVMFYNIFEEKAPVYRNRNLRHMLDVYKKESKTRETWYYPESAYWITFDNSIPMTLLPYLKARLDDIRLMDSLNAEGHITFSSGWEWGYWLTDWSIARWSWDHSFNNKKMHNDYLQYLSDVLPDKNLLENMQSILDLQQDFIKSKELIRYMSALSFSDELPEFIKLEFQPKPIYRNKYILKKALPYQLDTLKINAVEPMLLFSDSCLKTLTEKQFIPENNLQKKLKDELLNGLKITALRASHKANILQYYIEKRESGIKKQEFSDKNGRLKKAEEIRIQALEIVKNQEKYYRYPYNTISGTFKSKTAYNFGYLYTVSNLHYWQREEQQALKNKQSPFFMNIMDIWRIIGIKN